MFEFGMGWTISYERMQIDEMIRNIENQNGEAFSKWNINMMNQLQVLTMYKSIIC